MNSELRLHPVPIPDFLQRIYNKPLIHVTLPFSTSALDSLAALANIHSNMLLNVVFFSHNNFEIDVWMDAAEEEPTSPDDIVCNENPEKTGNTEPGERLFLQYMALTRAAVDMGLECIDFHGCRVQSNDLLQFPLILTNRGTKEPANHLPGLLQRCIPFDSPDEYQLLDLFNRLKTKHTFAEDQVYLYRYDDFATSFLDSYHLTGPNKKPGLKIRVNARLPVWRGMIKRNLFANHHSPGVFFAHLDNRDDNLPSAIARLFSIPGTTGTGGTGGTEENGNTGVDDFIAVINRLHLFMQQSAFTSLLLMTDRLRTRVDAEFINYLLDAPGFTDTVFICFDPDCTVMDFDLDFNEKPGNLLAKYLDFQAPCNEDSFDPAELHILKIISSLPAPVRKEQLDALLSPGQTVILERLIKKNVLKLNNGTGVASGCLSHLNLKIARDEEEQVLASLMESPGADLPEVKPVKLKYFILSRQWERCKETLKALSTAKREPEHGENETDFDFAIFKPILKENYAALVKEADMELLEMLVSPALAAGEFDFARELILDSGGNGRSALLALKLAHIYKWEKEYRKMDACLREIEARNPDSAGEYDSDEYHYFRFVYHEMVSGAGTEPAELHRKKIKGDLYRHRAAVLLSDRFLFKGEFDKVESLLSEAAAYFHRGNLTGDEIEAWSHLAKLHRETRQWTEAESLYQNLFIKSQGKNYRLLSAYIAIDLGNLYWTRENINAADTWYRKALKIFQQQKNRNGMILAKSNLVEVDKITGDWVESKTHLEDVFAYNKERNAVLSLAIDYFNIGHLEYMKHRFPLARECTRNARAMFEKSDNRSYTAECDILELKIAFLEHAPNRLEHIDSSLFHLDNYRTRIDEDMTGLVSILEMAQKDPDNKKGASILQKLNQVKSPAIRFEIITLIASKYRTPGLAELLKSLSIALARGEKNYYYFEYLYTYYSYFFTGREIPAQEKDRFNEVYWFFQRNGRRLNLTINKYKELLEAKDSQYDIFKSAELDGNYLHWRLPEDFFHSLVGEVRGFLPVDFVKLTLYEKGADPGAPLFDFACCPGGGNWNLFKDLTREIAGRAAYTLDSRDLSLEDIRKNYHSSERVFYPFNNTKVIFWKLSETLFGVLILAFTGEEYRGYDFFQRHADLFDTFAALISRFYEKDFNLNRKLAFIIGESPAIKQLKEKILKVSKVDFGVLIRGESGSGKELVAKAVHLLSPRAREPFIPVNAAAIPENLLEAELFGYKKGAFTGASENKTGLIEAAHNGSLFLDEIADLPLNLQAKLLRVLQENEIRRLGETKTRTIDVRLICATNKDLTRMIQENRFREDLYFRIQDLTLHVPPLRERPEDIPMLVTHFLKKYGFEFPDNEALQRITASFKNRAWKGNVRELESNIKRLITYYPDFDLERELGQPENESTGLSVVREAIERSMILKALKQHNNNRSAAAASLKITRQYLLKLMKRHKILLP